LLPERILLQRQLLQEPSRQVVPNCAAGRQARRAFSAHQ
jgi:hypothetical protein